MLQPWPPRPLPRSGKGWFRLCPPHLSAAGRRVGRRGQAGSENSHLKSSCPSSLSGLDQGCLRDTKGAAPSQARGDEGETSSMGLFHPGRIPSPHSNFPSIPTLEHLALVGVGEHQAWIAGHLGGPSLWEIILRPLPPAERALHGLSHVAPPALTLCSFRFSVHRGLGGIKEHQKDWHSSPTFKILPSGIALSLVPKVQPGLLASMSRPGSHPIPSCSQTLWGLGSSIPPCHYPTS